MGIRNTGSPFVEVSRYLTLPRVESIEVGKLPPKMQLQHIPSNPVMQSQCFGVRMLFLSEVVPCLDSSSAVPRQTMQYLLSRE